MSDVKPNGAFSGGYSELNEILTYDGVLFIEKVYTFFLNRSPDSLGLKFYLARLNSGVSKKKIIYDLASSKEARGLGVNSMHLRLELMSDRISSIPLISNVFSGVLSTNQINRLSAIAALPIVSNAEMQLKKVMTARKKPEITTVEKSNTDLENMMGLFSSLLEQHGTLISQQGQLIAKLTGQPSAGGIKTVDGSSESAENVNKIHYENSGLSGRAKLIQAGIHKKLHTKSGT